MTLPDPIEEFNILLLPQLLKQARKDAIEECARVAVEFMTRVYDEDKIGEAIADAIRALKEKA